MSSFYFIVFPCIVAIFTPQPCFICANVEQTVSEFEGPEGQLLSAFSLEMQVFFIHPAFLNNLPHGLYSSLKACNQQHECS